MKKIMLIFSLVFYFSLLCSTSDDFGYVSLSSQDGDTIDFNWIEIENTGNRLDLSDYDTISVALSFSFPFYDRVYDTIIIQSNGAISFNRFYLGTQNEDLPTNAYGGPYDLVCLFWEELIINSSKGVFYQDFDSCVVIEFDSVFVYAGTQSNKFEVILYDNGDIKLQYLYINDYFKATIGIQDSTAYYNLNGWFEEYVYNGLPSDHIPSNETVVLYKYPVEDTNGIIKNSIKNNTDIHILFDVNNIVFLTDMAQKEKIEIFDIIGRKKMDKTISLLPGKTSISIQGLEKGVYFIYLKRNNNIVLKKKIIKIL